MLCSTLSPTSKSPTLKASEDLCCVHQVAKRRRSCRCVPTSTSTSTSSRGREYRFSAENCNSQQHHARFNVLCQTTCYLLQGRLCCVPVASRDRRVILARKSTSGAPSLTRLTTVNPWVAGAIHGCSARSPDRNRDLDGGPPRAVGPKGSVTVDVVVSWGTQEYMGEEISLYMKECMGKESSLDKKAEIQEALGISAWGGLDGMFPATFSQAGGKVLPPWNAGYNPAFGGGLCPPFRRLAEAKAAKDMADCMDKKATQPSGPSCPTEVPSLPSTPGSASSGASCDGDTVYFTSMEDLEKDMMMQAYNAAPTTIWTWI